jgi:hypothetical protein
MSEILRLNIAIAVQWLRRLVAGLTPRRPGFAPGQSMWDLWWTEWHWDRFFSELFGFTLSVSFHRRSSNSYHGGMNNIYVSGSSSETSHLIEINQ